MHSLAPAIGLILLRGIVAQEAWDGDAMLRVWLKTEVAATLEPSTFGLDAKSWPAERARRRTQLVRMLGLPDLDAKRSALQPTVTGTIERADLGIVVEKLHFQSLPGLYVTANLYRPRTVTERLPAILYLCGHSRQIENGISYGNKFGYHHHGVWFARHGYVCLIVDSLQLGEVRGLHAGTHDHDHWDWVARGYMPSGVEAWNSIRALDYLTSRPEVDAERIGVTGRSGGGIGSWWLAALDDRPKAVAPVAGITDLHAHVLGGVIRGHCDCNYAINYFGWDYSMVAALAAPTPLLHANSDRDTIFPLDGVLRIHERARWVYDAIGSREQLGLSITNGGHEDTQDLRIPVFRWMARWLKDDAESIVSVPATKVFEREELRVLRTAPDDAINATIHETFVPQATPPPMPDNRAALVTWRDRALAQLAATTFARLPDPGVEPLEVEAVEHAQLDGCWLSLYRFRSDHAFDLPLLLLRPMHSAPIRVRLEIADETSWAQRRKPDAALIATLNEDRSVLAVVAPRGVGPTHWRAPRGGRDDVTRRFMALGRPLDELHLHDVRRAVRALAVIPFLTAPIREHLILEGTGRAAGIALYAGILEPTVRRLVLRELPASHTAGPYFKGVLRIVDLPRAVALFFPRKVNLHDVPRQPFAWTEYAAARTNSPLAIY